MGLHCIFSTRDGHNTHLLVGTPGIKDAFLSSAGAFKARLVPGRPQSPTPVVTAYGIESMESGVDGRGPVYVKARVCLKLHTPLG
jgi:hypothetical protein